MSQEKLLAPPHPIKKARGLSTIPPQRLSVTRAVLRQVPAGYGGVRSVPSAHSPATLPAGFGKSISVPGHKLPLERDTLVVQAPPPRRNDDAHSGSRIAAFPLAKFRNGERAELENLDLAACPSLFLDG